jgi:hypothetical protein
LDLTPDFAFDLGFDLAIAALSVCRSLAGRPLPRKPQKPEKPGY